MRLRTGRKAAVVMACATLGLSACGSSADSGDSSLESFEVGIIGASMAQAPLYVAIDQGFLDDEDIKVRITDFAGGGSQPTSALAAGSVDMLAVGAPNMLIAKASGTIDTRFFYEFYDAAFDIVGNKDVSSLDELKKGKVAVSAIGSQDQIWFQYAVKREGYDPADFSYVTGGPTAQRLAGVVNGAFDGAAMSTQTRSTYESQTSILADSKDTGNRLPAVLMATKADYLDDNEESLGKLVDALNAGAKFARDPANKDSVLNSCVKYTKNPKATCEAGYTTFIEDTSGFTWSDTGAINVEGIAATIEAASEIDEQVKGLDAEDVVDDRFTR